MEMQWKQRKGERMREQENEGRGGAEGEKKKKEGLCQKRKNEGRDFLLMTIPARDKAETRNKDKIATCTLKPSGFTEHHQPLTTDV